MRYIKKISGHIGGFDSNGNFNGTEIQQLIEYHGYQRGESWFNANGWLEYDGVLPLWQLDITADGKIMELPPPDPTEEWVDTELFINALYRILSGEKIQEIMADSQSLKEAVAGIALLSSNAAPGMVNLLDPRVGSWLALAGSDPDTIRQIIDNK